MAWAGQESVCLIPFGGGTSVTRALEVPSIQIEPRPVVSVDMRKVRLRTVALVSYSSVRLFESLLLQRCTWIALETLEKSCSRSTLAKLISDVVYPFVQYTH